MQSARELWTLLDKAQRRAAILLLGLMAGGMVLETLGIGLVIPALGLMVHGDAVARYPTIAYVVRPFGSPTREQIVIGGLAFLVTVFAVRAAFLAYLSWRQMRFVFDLQADLSARLFAGYLRQPYSFHLQRNSAELIRNALVETAVLTNVTQPGLIVMTESAALLGVLGLLLVVEPLGTVLVAGTLGMSSWLFHRFTSSRATGWGEARQLHEGRRLQYLQEGLGAAKDVKVLGREAEFVAQYARHNTASAKVAQHHFTLQALPRLWLEFTAVVGLVMLVVVIIGQGKPLESVLPTLGLFAVVAFRVLPSISRTVNSIHSIRYALPAIHVLHDEFGLIGEATSQAADNQSISFERALVLDRVWFGYSLTAAPVLCDVSLSIARGSSVGFVGTTGAGKSTLVDVLLGLLTPERGAVCVDGVDIQTNLRGWQRQIGYVPQSIFLTDDTLRRNVAFGLPDHEIDEDRLRSAIQAAQLDEFIEGLPLGLNTIVGERGVRLSGGQCQRIGIARALYHDPAVLVLDEATSALDVVTEREVMTAVRALRGNKTLVIVTHRLATVEECDCVFYLDGGALREANAELLVRLRNAGQGNSSVQELELQ